MPGRLPDDDNKPFKPERASRTPGSLRMSRVAVEVNSRCRGWSHVAVNIRSIPTGSPMPGPAGLIRVTTGGSPPSVSHLSCPFISSSTPDWASRYNHVIICRTNSTCIHTTPYIQTNARITVRSACVRGIYLLYWVAATWTMNVHTKLMVPINQKTIQNTAIVGSVERFGRER